MYYWKCYLWEGGRKTKDLSNYLTAPIFIEDHLDETMDTGEIILDKMPLETRDLFPPKTKICLERYSTKELVDQPRHFDMIVEHDDVEEYIGFKNTCCHRIYLQEASVIAQGMHIDNIALTYELQDVNLNYKTIKDDSTQIGDRASNIAPGGYSQALRQTDNIGYAEGGTYRYFRNSYRYEWDIASISSIKSLKLNYSGEQSYHIQFTIPTLLCQGCYTEGNWTNLFEMNTITRVYEIKTNNGQEISRRLVIEQECGPISIPSANDEVYYSDGTNAQLRAVNDWEDDGDTYINQFNREWTTNPIIATAKSSYTNKIIEFSTTQLSDAELAEGYAITYSITCAANPVNQSGMIMNYEKQFYGTSTTFPFWDGYGINYTTSLKGQCKTTKNEVVEATSVVVNASFICKDMSENAEGGPFLMKGVKYSCYDLLEKALLTIDTQILDNTVIGLDELKNQYPIYVHADWIDRLKSAKMQETIFEGKNLWEVLLQIGYYLHAIPYLEFSEDGTDRLALKFRQLGDTRVRKDTNTKITVFNSRNLSEYFTQYDSYVTNLFSPQNEIDEWIVPKTSDSSFLISNNTAELKTSRPILEVIKFEIVYDGSVGGSAGTADALQYIFEESIYQILTSDNPIKIKPAKGNSIYYTLGTNTIKGLNYVPPEKNSGDFALSLQEICRRLFGQGTYFDSKRLKFNNLMFHIRYRTQDELRISQVRPDIQNFMNNSNMEKYPHHEQYYGQQDKIIDSERFSANLFGQLIRVGNNVYQRQERVSEGDEKESGDLVEIKDEAYYVTEIENEYYPDEIFQKVTYSKNFNQLSNIVTIPSEPRFYEVSERSKVRREVRMMEFLELSTSKPEGSTIPRYLNKTTWRDLIKGLLFYKQKPILPNFAYTKFVADYRRNHTGSYGQFVQPNQLFPSSEVDRTNPNNILPKNASDNSQCIVSLLHFPLHDGIVFEWDMEDNFKVGDYVETEVGDENNQSTNDSYYGQQSHRYVDIMGRADLFTFKLFYKDNWTKGQAQQLPKAVIEPTEEESAIYIPSPYLIGLDKDNREELSFDFQINLLHRATASDTEDFFTFPNLFGEKDSELKMCLLDETQSLFNENINLTPAHILADNVQYSLNDTENALEIKISRPNIDLEKVKSIVLYQENEQGERYAYIVKNVSKQNNEEKLKSWWIFPVFNQ